METCSGFQLLMDSQTKNHQLCDEAAALHRSVEESERRRPSENGSPGLSDR